MNNNVHFLPCNVIENEDKKIYDVKFLTDECIVTGDVSGTLNYYKIDDNNSLLKTGSVILSTDTSDPPSIFSISHYDKQLVGGLSNGNITLVNNNKIVHTYSASNINKNSISKVLFIDNNIFSVGTNAGEVSLFDIRSKSKVGTMKEQTEEISDLAHCEEHDNNLLSSSIDGTLSVFDLRKRKLYALSDCIEDEINCIQIMRGGNKVVCGTGEGNLAIFNWDWFGDFKDRVVGHPLGILSMDKYSENIVITGCEDGGIRVCTIYPKGIRGMISEKNKVKKNKNKEFKDIENIAVSDNREYLVLSTNISCIKLFSIKEVEFDKLYKESNLEEQSENESEEENEDKEEEENEEEQKEDEVEEEEDEKEKKSVDEKEEFEEGDLSNEEEEEEDEEKSISEKEGDDQNSNGKDSEKEESNDNSENDIDDSSDSSEKEKKKKSKKVPTLGKKRKSDYVIENERRKEFFSDL